jgi:phage baseplate assembly protein V
VTTVGGFRLLDPESASPGAVIGIVTDVNDPDGLGMVQVELPWYGEGYREWARVVQPYAGDNVGSTWVPEKDGEVLVLFEHGNLRRPYVIGCLYSAVDRPPESRTASRDIRTVKTPSGAEIRVDETAQTVEIKTKSGASLLLEEKSGALTIKATQRLLLDATDIEIKASGSVKVTGTSIALN